MTRKQQNADRRPARRVRAREGTGPSPVKPLRRQARSSSPSSVLPHLALRPGQRSKAEDGNGGHPCRTSCGRPSGAATWIDKIGVDDRIRVIAADRSFDFELIVKAKQQGVGLLLKIEPVERELRATRTIRFLCKQAKQLGRQLPRSKPNGTGCMG